VKRSTLLWTAIIILFLLNAGTLGFLLTRPGAPGQGPEDGHRRFDAQVVETLSLSPDQIAQFERMKRAHHEEMLRLDEATSAPFAQYFGLLQQTPGNLDAKDSLQQVIAALYAKRMDITYRHFAELKAICTPAQQQQFDRLIPSLMQVMSTGEKNMPPPRRKR